MLVCIPQCSLASLLHSPLLNILHDMAYCTRTLRAENKSIFPFTAKIQYLTLTGELYDTFCEYFRASRPYKNKIILHTMALTYLGWDKMAAILQPTFSNWFSCLQQCWIRSTDGTFGLHWFTVKDDYTGYCSVGYIRQYGPKLAFSALAWWHLYAETAPNRHSALRWDMLLRYVFQIFFSKFFDKL